MAKRVAKIISSCLALVVGIAIVDCLLTGFFPDVAFLIPLHKCEKNVAALRDGQQVSCPLAAGATGYETFPEDGLGDTGKRFVVAADRDLFHQERTSFIFPPRRFAVVLLDNGRTECWAGDADDYRRALEEAHKSNEGRLPERFFARSTARRFPETE